MSRYIPFGYEILDAEIKIIEREAEVVRNVYSLYVQGLSFRTISERLNKIPITYAGDGRAWDKHMVKRMLENPKYTGAKGYPVIIPPETAELVLKLKDEKVILVDKEDKPRLDAYRKKAECSICGSKMRRRHAGSGKRRRRYWNCANPECDGNHHIFHEKLLDKLMTEVINELAENIEMADYAESKEFEKDTEIIKATNEMNEAIDDIEMDIEDVIDKIMGLASVKFNKCTIGSNIAITEIIKQKLAIYPQKEMVDGEIMNQIVKKIKMHPNKTIWVELINGKEIERKEKKDECSIC